MPLPSMYFMFVYLMFGVLGMIQKLYAFCLFVDGNEKSRYYYAQWHSVDQFWCWIWWSNNCRIESYLDIVLNSRSQHPSNRYVESLFEDNQRWSIGINIAAWVNEGSSEGLDQNFHRRARYKNFLSIQIACIIYICHHWHCNIHRTIWVIYYFKINASGF